MRVDGWDITRYVRNLYIYDRCSRSHIVLGHNGVSSRPIKRINNSSYMRRMKNIWVDVPDLTPPLRGSVRRVISDVERGGKRIYQKLAKNELLCLTCNQQFCFETSFGMP